MSTITKEQAQVLHEAAEIVEEMHSHLDARNVAVHTLGLATGDFTEIIVDLEDLDQVPAGVEYEEEHGARLYRWSEHGVEFRVRVRLPELAAHLEAELAVLRGERGRPS